MGARRYLLSMLTVAVVAILAAATVNVLIDPYNVFGTPRIGKLNALKPHAGDRGRTAKLHQVVRAAPNALILGNSRAEMGLDPAHPCWPVSPAYNLAVPGLTFDRQILLARHAEAHHDIELVLLSVDFLDFLDLSAQRQGAPFWPPRPSVGFAAAVDANGRPRSGWWLERQVDRFRAAVSLEALADSVTTVLAQHRGHTPTRTELGFFPADALYVPIVNNEGVQALFTQKNRQVAARLSPELTLFAPGTEWSVEFETLRRYLTERKARGRQSVLYINPYHAEYLLLLHANGLWNDFERWKRMLVDVAAGLGVPLFDFATFDTHASEPVAGLAARGEALEWFWEPSHYRAGLGDRMLATMLAAHCADRGFGSFGAELSDAELAPHLAGIRARRDAYIDANPDVLARLRALAQTSVH